MARGVYRRRRHRVYRPKSIFTKSPSKFSVLRRRDRFQRRRRFRIRRRRFVIFTKTVGGNTYEVSITVGGQLNFTTTTTLDIFPGTQFGANLDNPLERTIDFDKVLTFTIQSNLSLIGGLDLNGSINFNSQLNTTFDRTITFDKTITLSNTGSFSITTTLDIFPGTIFGSTVTNTPVRVIDFDKVLTFTLQNSINVDKLLEVERSLLFTTGLALNLLADMIVSAIAQFNNQLTFQTVANLVCNNQINLTCSPNCICTTSSDLIKFINDQMEESGFRSELLNVIEDRIKMINDSVTPGDSQMGGFNNEKLG